MFCGGEGRKWTCGNAGVVRLQKVASFVQDLSQPCLSQSGIQVLLNIGKMLKPEKWRAFFDCDGKVSGFHKALKLIILGGIDPSIRAEVWEFLLGCYALSSTSEYRRQLRVARRERYNELLKQCQMMHSSVGTGSLAYVVGSKVMDMRKSYKNEVVKETTDESTEASTDGHENTENHGDSSNNDTDTSHAHRTGSSSESVDLVSPDSTIVETSSFVPLSSPRGFPSSGPCVADGFFEFPSLPVTDLFGRSSLGKKGDSTPNKEASMQKLSQLVHADSVEELSHSGSTTEIVDGLRISDEPDMPSGNETPSRGGTVRDDRMSEWLWTLHRIVVDVVRTDTHMEFYEDPRNIGRMSDILAVYAWVDPATGYCQGMSDLVSPFVVLFEDNADAFWCFEMLIRRTRANFQKEGPTGVMDQLLICLFVFSSALFSEIP
ncbi:unnamed protein product [Microthlaspi erraticum]|uniref:Rab-GAP TBC domain-containing protein n=1 Tax=Microthlaspi erraticum TaxID=1685480 RepID=A0A6D2HTY9_9BRAS|nr:unnamed protein product [Microthlaspi erraticum]